MIKLHFYLRFHTEFGQSIWLTGDCEEMGNDDESKAIPMEYLNEDFWQCSIEIKRKDIRDACTYKYFLKNKDGEILYEYGHDRELKLTRKNVEEIQFVDTWNYAGEFENVSYSDAFNNVLLSSRRSKSKATNDKSFTHVFKVKAPLLRKNETVCLLGQGSKLSNWNENNPVMMKLEDNWWTVRLDLSDIDFPAPYKYGIYNIKEEKFVAFEEGNNRLVYSDAAKKKQTILHDGFVHIANDTWKGAGVAIPVFSLRGKNSFGVGEFTDIKLLVDWAKSVGLKLIQLLPINDTIAKFDWMDSYPYSAVSAFALHPLYINLWKVAGEDYSEQLASLKSKQKELNELAVMDYEEVIKYKLSVLKELYEVTGKDCFESEDYDVFFKENKHWLEPYAAFCFFRDKYGSSDFLDWESNNVYDENEIASLCSGKSASFKAIGFYYFIQYQLHLQLKSAVEYAHKKGIVIKGDIPIGISRNSCDAWIAPEMYNMCWQAGAPPDDFTAVGQNWGFPTYNWKKMQENGFAWWKQRFKQMSNYFDAFRIDHILGFFRIWSIPVDAVQGILGRFVPCLPVHINEFGENGIWFDYQRYCRPHITDNVLDAIFGELATAVKERYLQPNEHDGYDLAPGFETQREIEAFFNALEESEENNRFRAGLYDLVSNVIFYDEQDSQGTHFHFRISMEKTLSFKMLPVLTQEKLQALYINYFYRRQDDFWFKEAMHKLPQLKAATNMLVCGEDLGMVPHCVPEVMQQLGILSLEIQRMPKDPQKEFFHPNDAPYLSVITPSTHDMSTIRGWWEENHERTKHFYNNVMGQWGEAPQYCEAWINRAIVLQHLYSPAMWSIFQLQDILGMSETLRRENPEDERINNPANDKHYWQYRMHINLEDLLKEKEFNDELEGYVMHSGRA